MSAADNKGLAGCGPSAACLGRLQLQLQLPGLHACSPASQTRGWRCSMTQRYTRRLPSCSREGTGPSSFAQCEATIMAGQNRSKAEHPASQQQSASHSQAACASIPPAACPLACTLFAAILRSLAWAAITPTSRVGYSLRQHTAVQQYTSVHCVRQLCCSRSGAGGC